jgi:hypothetical protein
MRKNLVICPCGDDSLHKTWFTNERTFDIFVIYYGDNIANVANTSDYIIQAKGLKFELGRTVLIPHFLKDPAFYERYEYIWYPDSDLKISVADIDRMFVLAKERGAEIFTPSIANHLYPEQFDPSKKWDSWDDMKTNPKMLYRRITNPEIMMPGFSLTAFKDIFIKSLILFPQYKVGWGIEAVWHALSYAKNPLIPVPHFIFDDVHVFHMKPVAEGSMYLHDLGKQELGIYRNYYVSGNWATTLEEFPKL